MNICAFSIGYKKQSSYTKIEFSLKLVRLIILKQEDESYQYPLCIHKCMTFPGQICCINKIYKVSMLWVHHELLAQCVKYFFLVPAPVFGLTVFTGELYKQVLIPKLIFSPLFNFLCISPTVKLRGSNCDLKMNTESVMKTAKWKFNLQWVLTDK